ncbi:MAG: methyltransferase domain-containing protein [Armatimonadetes bacterium]|nr:methyltransferase domain-containing protein [Armatimonadota bacterium]
MQRQKGVKESTADRFGENAAKYAVSRGHSDARSLEELVHWVGPSPSDRLLDVATGAGHTALAFAPHVREVIAFDLSQGMLDQTLKTASKRGLTNVSAQLGDAEALPFEDGSFEVVTCRIAAHHFPDQPRFFREAARVLKLGGKLAFVDNYGPEPAETARQIEEIERLRDWTHHRTWTLAELRSQFSKAGLKLLWEEVQNPKHAVEIELEDWCKRIGTPEKEADELRERFEGADEALKTALAIRIKGNTITFKLPKVTLIAVKAQQLRPEAP